MSLEGPEGEKGMVPQPPRRSEYPWFQYVVCGMLSSLFRHSRRVKRIFGDMGGMPLLLGILGVSSCSERESRDDPTQCLPPFPSPHSLRFLFRAQGIPSYAKLLSWP